MKKLLYLFTILSCVLLTSCGGDDDEPKTTYKDITLACKATYTIAGDASWTSSNELVASVTGNIVTAQRVGEATITSSKGSFKVTVTPTVSVYKEPYTKWGASKTTVKSFMSGSVLDSEDSESLIYKGSGAVAATYYGFENGGLKSSGLALKGSYISSDALMEQMLQYYVPVSMDESKYSFYFLSADKKTFVMLQLTASGSSVNYVIMYIPYSDSKSRANVSNFESILNTINIPTDTAPVEKFDEIKDILF